MFSISIANGLEPNISIIFLNISVVDRSLQIFYKIDPYRGTSSPLDIDKRVDIIMIDYFPLKQKTIGNRKNIICKKSRTKCLCLTLNLFIEFTFK